MSLVVPAHNGWRLGFGACLSSCDYFHLPNRCYWRFELEKFSGVAASLAMHLYHNIYIYHTYIHTSVNFVNDFGIVKY